MSAAFSFQPASRVTGFKETVWQEFSPLALKTGAVNLGQGFPNWSPADSALHAAVEIMDASKPSSEIAPFNQYARSGGHMPLVQAIADFYSGPLGQTINPATDVLVTAGASEGLFAAGQAFLDKGDECIVFEPFFDIYGGSMSFAGAKLVPVQLHLKKPKRNEDGTEPALSSSMYQFDVDELKSAFSEKTKMIWINTPHNPTGKMFSLEELEIIADLVRQYPRVIVLSDEVYEWITYDNNVHHRFATLPGMWDRTLTVTSAAKTFSLTGWKIGWTIAPAHLISAMSRAHEFIIYCVATPLQESLARTLREIAKNDYLAVLKQKYLARREILVDALKKAGLNPIVPQGAFYITVDVSHIHLASSDGLQTVTGINMDWHDWKVARWFTATVGVTPIPCSAFYVPEHIKTASILRFAFCKTEELLHDAAARFAAVPKLLEDSQKKRTQEEVVNQQM
jgi:aspartate/methionine/tyrosine aminotransferase